MRYRIGQVSKANANAYVSTNASPRRAGCGWAKPQLTTIVAAAPITNATTPTHANRPTHVSRPPITAAASGRRVVLRRATPRRHGGLVSRPPLPQELLLVVGGESAEQVRELLSRLLTA